MVQNVVTIMAAEIQAIAMEVPRSAHPQRTKQIKQFAIKNSFVLWANVLALFALHTGLSHANALPAREIKKPSRVSCAVNYPVKINHA